MVGLLVGCQQGANISSNIQRALSEKGGVDLAATVPGQWERVCVLGPYSNNATASQTLGFPWDVESHSSIVSNDGISLLLFVQDSKVIAYTEHERRFGDFSNLSGRCFPRSNARFARQDEKRPSVVPVDEAQPATK
jgi:hypothetical protein